MVHLSAQHQRVLERFAAACRDDRDVVAAFLGGAHAAGTADRYSDLDFYLVTTDEGYDRFFARRMDFVRGWSAPVFLEDFSEFGFDMLICIFDDAAGGELALARESHFRHIHGGPYRVLVDKKGILAVVTFPYYRQPEEEQRRAVRRDTAWFWRDLWEFTRALARARHITAAGHLGSMRVRVVRLMRFHTLAGSAPDGARSTELVLAPAQLARLQETYGGVGTRAQVETAYRLVDLYRETVRTLAEAGVAVYPESLDRTVGPLLAPYQR